MHQATLTTTSSDGESVSLALDVDNLGDRELVIGTRSNEDGRVTTEVKAKSLRTLLSTLDDVIHCQIVAEKIIDKE